MNCAEVARWNRRLKLNRISNIDRACHRKRAAAEVSNIDGSGHGHRLRRCIDNRDADWGRTWLWVLPKPCHMGGQDKAPASKTNVACRKFIVLIFLTSWDYFFLLRDKLYFRGVLAFTVFEYAESPAEFTARIR